MAMKRFNLHADWIRLLETNLPIFSSAVLQAAYPQGFPVPSVETVRRLRWDYAAWRDFHRNRKSVGASNDIAVQAVDDEWIKSITSDPL